MALAAVGQCAAGAQQRSAACRLHVVLADRSSRLGHHARQDRGTVNPLGLYDLDRQIRPVGRAYKQLIERWQTVLPVQSVCLMVPVVLPSEYEEAGATRRREWMREYHRAEQSYRQSGGQIVQPASD